MRDRTTAAAAGMRGAARRFDGGRQRGGRRWPFAALALLLLLSPSAALADDFPAPAPYQQHASDIAVQDYLAREVTEGVPALWQDGHLTDAAGEQYAPPEWFARELPAATLAGNITAKNLRADEVRRILRTPQAAQAWRKLRFVAHDLPQGEGGFLQRRQELQRLADAADSAYFTVAPAREFANAAALKTALDAMYADGGEGYVLRHKESPYEAAGAEYLLALPYQTGEAVVTGHTPGRGGYAGLMGGLRVRAEDGGEFAIGTGFSREMRRNPPAVGARILYKFKGYTANAKPQSPVFLQTLQTRAPQKKLFGLIGAAHVMWFFIFLMLVLTALDAITHRAGGRAWDFKSAIVSTGLLGTFVGVFWGLAEFNTDDIAAGVPALLEGLKLAFVTSIAGIALSTGLSVAQTIFGARR